MCPTQVVRGQYLGDIVALSDFCEVKGQYGSSHLHGITTAEHNFKLVPAIDLTLGYPAIFGGVQGQRHNTFMDSDESSSFSTSNIPAKWGKVTGIRCMNDFLHYVDVATNIVVIAGAGISTSLGIPDFRSITTGMYPQLKDDLLEHGFGDPQEIFDLQQFKDDPSIFYSFYKKLMPKSEGVSLAHKFLKSLQDQGKLLTVYTQNVDDLEIKAGVTKDKVVQVHGTSSSFSCIKCGIVIADDAIKMQAANGEVPRCSACPQSPPRRKIKKGKKSVKRGRTPYDSDDEDSEGDVDARGVLKPNIVFFGEDLDVEYKHRLAQDAPKCDLVIVMGTSLKVAPASNIIDLLPDSALKLWINVEIPPPGKAGKFDGQLLGSCDVVVGGLAKYMRLSISDELFQKLERQQVVVELEDPGVFKFSWIKEVPWRPEEDFVLDTWDRLKVVKKE